MYINATAKSVMLQICALLGFYAAQNGSFLPKFTLEPNFNIYSIRVFPPPPFRKWKIVGAHPEQPTEVKSQVTSDRTSKCTRNCEEKILGSVTVDRWNMSYGHASTKLTKRTTQFDVFKNRVLGENFPTTKKTSLPPPISYCRVCGCKGKFW